MDDSGINNDLPGNPYLHRAPEGTVKGYPGEVLYFYPELIVAEDGRHVWIHNDWGRLYEAHFDGNRIYLGKRRVDIEFHNPLTSRELRRRKNDPEHFTFSEGGNPITDDTRRVPRHG